MPVATFVSPQGARAASAETGTRSDGVAAADAFVSDAGGDDVLSAVSVTADRTATTVTVTVTGHSLSVIPGWTPRIEQSASLPTERITEP